ncbi:MAG TPA: V-type ATP synthase subunit F [bacterium]|nr:V-type ATP synthase subunit F [bacterium]HOM26191.1 V-type ATP synthase subunit F [bacterium]
MENRIIFIGDKLSIEFFSAFNIETFFANSVKEAEEILEKIDMKDVICIFITEEVFDEDKFMKFLNMKKMVVIPGLKSREGKGVKIVDELIKKATGMKGD